MDTVKYEVKSANDSVDEKPKVLNSYTNRTQADVEAKSLSSIESARTGELFPDVYYYVSEVRVPN